MIFHRAHEANSPHFLASVEIQIIRLYSRWSITALIFRCLAYIVFYGEQYTAEKVQKRLRACCHFQRLNAIRM